MAERKAFTLLELLVVIAIVSFLLAILAPSLIGAVGRARTALCGNNLRRIGEVVQARIGYGKDVEKLTPYGWPDEVSTFVKNTDILLCPEADDVPEGGGGVHAPLKDFIRIAYDNSGRAIDFVESGIMVKASQAQFEQYTASMGQRVLKGVWASGEGYIDDGSGVFYWGYEDQGVGGDDYQDVFIKVTQLPNGWSELECKSETSGHPVIQDIYTDEFLVTREEFNYWAAPRGWKSKTILLKTAFGSGASNYAVNAHNVGKYGVGKILALDYIWTIARAADDWQSPRFDADGDNSPDFARHGRKTNVLFSGGSVELKRTDDIDPAFAQVEENYWLP